MKLIIHSFILNVLIILCSSIPFQKLGFGKFGNFLKLNNSASKVKLSKALKLLEKRFIQFSERHIIFFNKIKTKFGVDQFSNTSNPLDDEFFNNLEKYNKAALGDLNKLLIKDDNWHLVAEKDGVIVERRYLHAGIFVDKDDAEKGTKHACIKSSAIIDAKPSDVFDLFVDSSRINEFNEHVITNKDVYFFRKKSKNEWSKISYATGPRMGPFKPRDFCSVVNFMKNSDGSYLILNRPAYYSKTKSNDKYVRATVLLAGNIIQPYGNNKTLLTLIAHINPGGNADTKAAAWVINNLCSVGPPNFMRKIERTIQKNNLNKG